MNKQIDKVSEFIKQYPSTLESEAEMFDDLNCFLAEHGLAGRIAHLFRLCVSEAFTNALEHGNKFSADKKVSMELRVNDETVTADIEDEGEGGLAEIQRRKRAGSLDEGGRGVDLIYRHAAEVEVSEAARGGVKIRIGFNREAFSAPDKEKAK